MSAPRNTFALWKQVQPVLSTLPSMAVLSAVAVLSAGAAVIYFLPLESNGAPQAVASAPANTSEVTPDESGCDKQAWPYMDQRCAQRVDKARGLREVRIVTDKGHSVTTMTPQPIVEEKPKPAPPPVAAQNDKPMGPPAAPAVAGNAAPQTEKIASAPPAPAPAPKKPAPEPTPAPAVQTATAPANPPAGTATPRQAPTPSANDARTEGVPPAAASVAPPAPGVDAFAESRQKKSKSARAAQKEAEKAAKREAKRAKKLEQEDPDDEGEEVVGSANSQPASTRSSSRRGREDAPDEVIESAAKAASNDRGRRSSRRTREAVPDEVIEAVERAVSADRGRRGRQSVTVEAEDGGGRRIYVVPREERF